jgi:hypothetical protein
VKVFLQTTAFHYDMVVSKYQEQAYLLINISRVGAEKLYKIVGRTGCLKCVGYIGE